MTAEVQAVRLTNKRRDVPLRIPDGQGGRINLDPGETKLIYGVYSYFKDMPRKGVTGLVVKSEPGMKVPASARAHVDVHLCRITNHKNIPVRLALGVDRAFVNLAPKESVECVARESIVKQLEGISCHRLSAPKPPARNDEDRAVKAKKTPVVKVKVKTRKVEESVEKNAEEVREVGAAGKLADLRESFNMPGTRKEWLSWSRNLGWHDLRVIARALGLKAKGREESRDKIAEVAYPE